MSAAVVDHGLFLDVDLDSEPGCETPDGHCLSGYIEPARFAQITWCGCQELACTPCAESVRRDLRYSIMANLPGWTLTCKLCGSETELPLRAAVKVVPL